MRTCSLVLLPLVACAAEPPSAQIASPHITARLYLPDPQNGYYRGTRFDWSGVVSSLEYRGHQFFGLWFDKYEPTIHDAITGPVEEFLTGGAGLGYGEAKPGGIFIRIGAGGVRKPDEPAYQRFRTYEMVDPGKWAVRRGKDRVEFTHTLDAGNGYAYVYRKRVRLERDKPVMVIEHSLKNTGRRTIETSQYNHNFFVIDGRTSGPEFQVRFPFHLRAATPLRGPAELRGPEVVFLSELAKGQNVYGELGGFGPTPADYDIRVENRKAGAGVRITGDRPLSKLVFWSAPRTVCPEPYVDLRIEPGRQTRWKIAYEFYTLLDSRP